MVSKLITIRRSVILCTLLILTGLQSLKAQTEKHYGLFIAGKEVTDKDDFSDLRPEGWVSGTISYDPGARKLTLDNAVFNVPNDEVAFRFAETDEEFNIEVYGSHTVITSKGTTLSSAAPIKIFGAGAITFISENDAAILMENASQLTISDACRLDLRGKTYGIGGAADKSSSLMIEDATVKAQGATASIGRLAEFAMDLCHFAEPEGVEFKDGNVMQGDQICTAQIKIVPDEMRYGINICDKPLTSEDDFSDIKLDQITSGKVSYDPKTRTLTLEEAVIQMTGPLENAIDFDETSEPYTLVLKGANNEISSGRSAALSSGSPLTIKGEGAAVFTGEENCGIYIYNRSKLTIADGCTVTSNGKWAVSGNSYNLQEALLIDNATLKAKSTSNDGGGVIGFKEITLKDCEILKPTGAKIAKLTDDEGLTYMGIALDGKAVKGEVVIAPRSVGVAQVETSPRATTTIYTLSGLKVNESLDRLPKGLYIVNGQKVVKY